MHSWQHNVVVRAEFLAGSDKNTFQLHRRIKELLYVIGQPNFLYTNVEKGEDDEKIRLWWKSSNRIFGVAFKSNCDIEYTQLLGDDAIGTGIVDTGSKKGREDFKRLLHWLLFGSEPCPEEMT